MLYISRQLGHSKYAVVDTDDGSEEIVSRKQIAEIAAFGIEIRGTQVIPSWVNGKYSPVIGTIEVYQNEAYSSTLQTKTKVLQGVDVITSGGVITGIRWSDAIVKSGTRVRLSDYGDRCGECIFASAGWHDFGLIVVLDDKIKCKSKTFFEACTTCVTIDLREVSDDKVAKWVYQEWMVRNRMSALDDFILDKPERFELWEAYGVVIGEIKPKIKCFSQDVIKFVTKCFVKYFKSLADCDYVSTLNGVNEAALKSYIQKLNLDKEFWTRRIGTYEEVILRDSGVCQMLSIGTTCNPTHLSYFQEYVDHFVPPNEVKELYVKLCYRANQYFLKLGKEMRWIV